MSQSHAVGPFDHRLDPCVAEQTLHRGAADHRAVLEHRVRVGVAQHVEVGVHHDRCPILILVVVGALGLFTVGADYIVVWVVKALLKT